MLVSNPEEFRKNLRSKLNIFLKHEKRSTNLEKAIFNYSIKIAKEKKIVRKWIISIL